MVDIGSLVEASKSSIRSGNFDDALKNAEEAVRLSSGSPEAQLRRLISLFRLKRIGEAKSVSRFIGKGQEADMWREIVKKQPEIEIDVLRIPSDANKESQNKNVSSSTAASASSRASVPSATPSARTDWYQSSEVVTLVVYRKDLPSETDIKIEGKSLQIKSPDFEWKTQLSAEISPSESSYDLTPFKVEFKLKKALSGTWSSYNDPASVKTPAPTNNLNHTVAPKPPTNTNSRSGAEAASLSYNKWDTLEDSDDEAEAENKDPMKFFQSLYKNASPEVQKAMAKSYMESNGTALSTNWDDVKQKKVEVQPPQGMEAKKWE